jgi:hypothetical protein
MSWDLAAIDLAVASSGSIAIFAIYVHEMACLSNQD